MSDRQQFFSIDCVQSDPNLVKWGVPQGSVLAPILFNLYISQVEDIIRSHRLNVLQHSDDTQLYLSLKPKENEEAKTRQEACLVDLNNWFCANKLVCNTNKSNFIYFTSKFGNVSSSFSISFGSSVMHPIDVAQNLGVSWDKHLLMRSHISIICKTALLSLNRIGALRNYLDIGSMERLVHAFLFLVLKSMNTLFLC